MCNLFNHQFFIGFAFLASPVYAARVRQHDAGRGLGMNAQQLMRRVILPQAMRVVLPPTGNQVISMLKSTSLVSVLAIGDLLYQAQIIYSDNYQTIALLIVASLWYLVMTTVLTFFQTRLERRYGRGFDASAPRDRLAWKGFTR